MSDVVLTGQRRRSCLIAAACALLPAVIHGGLAPRYSLDGLALWLTLILWGGAMGGTFTAGMTLLGQRFTGTALIAANAVFSLTFGIGGMIGPLTVGSAMSAWGFPVDLAYGGHGLRRLRSLSLGNPASRPGPNTVNKRNYILDGIVGPPYSGSIERSRDMAKAPGRSDREGLTLIELMQIFPTEDHGRQCRQWFESHIWPDGRHCPHCGSTDTTGNKGNEARPYHCRDCKRHFSVRIGTLLERSKISYRKWAIAIYLHMTVLKGVSGMKLHRGFGDHAKDRVVHAPAHSQGVR